MKAYKIQKRLDILDDNLLEEVYRSLKFETILNEQNRFSSNEVTGLIWVLNTSVLFVAEYNMSLVT